MLILQIVNSDNMGIMSCFGRRLISLCSCWICFHTVARLLFLGHQVDSPILLVPDVCSGDLQVKKEYNLT